MTYSSLYARLYTALQEASETINSILRFYPAKLYSIGILLLQVLVWFQAIIIYRRLSGDLLILHYNINFGVDSVGSPMRIFLYPIIGLVIAIINFALIAAFPKRQESKFMTHVFLGSAVMTEVFLSLALLSIFLINFR